MADSGIDSRYAAQFQRGFDPAVHAPVKERRGPVPIDNGPAVVAQRVLPPPPVVERATAATDPEAVEEALPASRPRTEWALLAVGLVLLALGAWLFSKSVESSTMYQGVGTEFSDGLYYYAADRFPGPLIVGGVVAIVFWILLRGVRLPKGDA